ncbi:hypothetical protein NECAME_05121 [Necator americanus]|uniref:Uncharacterized protein n=1 Tax=Necator americanus TaxID=51031 RepID=W2SJT6_NECAM|nr:hypothetical protein NECAME_05121 [Necator americanus]ETN69798.1 hypothetical protein NECAME_05121 [Necator americanus]
MDVLHRLDEFRWMDQLKHSQNHYKPLVILLEEFMAVVAPGPNQPNDDDDDEEEDSDRSGTVVKN